MTSLKTSPGAERLLRKRLAARLRQQRCRARKRLARLQQMKDSSGSKKIKFTQPRHNQSLTPSCSERSKSHCQSNQMNKGVLLSTRQPIFPGSGNVERVISENSPPGCLPSTALEVPTPSRCHHFDHESNRTDYSSFNRSSQREYQQHNFRSPKTLYPKPQLSFSIPEKAAVEAMLALKSAPQEINTRPLQHPMLRDVINERHYYDGRNVLQPRVTHPRAFERVYLQMA
mmetsp:Transcript_4118/g.6256  ORF Transcript_4118/g.6256 Transcript_4118/m.6256 type:complete len:229 (+) Transcript_4118:33-719(+)